MEFYGRWLCSHASYRGVTEYYRNSPRVKSVKVSAKSLLIFRTTVLEASLEESKQKWIRCENMPKDVMKELRGRWVKNCNCNHRQVANLWTVPNKSRPLCISVKECLANIFYSVDSSTFGYHQYLDFRTVEANRVDTCLVNEGGVHCIWRLNLGDRCDNMSVRSNL